MRELAIGCCFAVVLLCTRGRAEELPSTWAHSNGLYSTLTASGSIFAVDRKWSRVFLDSAKPFWAPGPSGSAKITLWPTQVLFSVSVGMGTAITIDGKKASFSQLAAGQKATIQYILSVNYNVSSSLKCVATRIDVRTPSAPKKGGEASKSPRRSKQ
jgi:hypothetical protein